MKLTFVSRRNQAPKFSKVVAKSKKLVANFFFRNSNNKKSYMKNVLYINAKLQGFLGWGIPECFFHISKELQTTILVMYLIKNKQKQTVPNFYSKFVICWIYCVFHQRPSNLMLMDVHVSQRLAYITCALYYQPHIHVCQEVGLKS